MILHNQPRVVQASAVGAAVLVVAVMLLPGQLPRKAAVARMQQGGEGSCSSDVTKTLAPATIRLCEESQVTVGVWPSCPPAPANIVLIVDDQYKLFIQEPGERAGALKTAVQRLALDTHPNVRVAVVWLKGGQATMKLDLSNDSKAVMSVLDIPMVSRNGARKQCFECGYREAAKILAAAAKTSPDAVEATVLATMGVFIDDNTGLVRGANLVKARGATSITGCFGELYCVPDLIQAASARRFYLDYGEGGRLAELLRGVVSDSSEASLQEVTVTDVYPLSVTVIADSISPAAQLDPLARTLRWTFGQPVAESYTITYRVKPLHLGDWPLGIGSGVRVVDSRFRESTAAVPVPILSVPDDCLETPTPTATPESTPILTSTPGPTATWTPIATVTPTSIPAPTRRPAPAYLPLALREQCVPGHQHTDAALVIDASTTMRDDYTSAGRTKLDAAIDAARAFVATMSLPHDQAAVVAFNGDAEVVQVLTGRQADVEAALIRIPELVRQQTRIDRGIEQGHKELTSTRHKAGNRAVMILLTDGLANPEPALTAVRRAQEAKDDHITIFTIGLGRDAELNVAELQEMASQPDYFYLAPDGEDLLAIYRTIAVEIPCPAESFWGKR